MRFHHKISDKYFPTPIEVRLVEILGGTTLTLGFMRRYDNPLTITLSRGRLLRSKRFRRAVIDGRGVLANDIKWAIQIMGAEYEHDVVKAYERDEWLENHGWSLAYVRANDIWNNPQYVRQNLLPFIVR